MQTPTGVQYTRNGSFQLNSTGQLVTQEGYSVLGSDGAITMPQGTAEISSTGVISTDGAVAGQIKLVQFDASVPLTSLGQGYFSAPQAAASDATTDLSVRQGALENSNINPVESAVGLIEIQRNAEMLQRALNTIHTEFNRTAAEELPKV